MDKQKYVQTQFFNLVSTFDDDDDVLLADFDHGARRLVSTESSQLAEDIIVHYCMR